MTTLPSTATSTAQGRRIDREYLRFLSAVRFCRSREDVLRIVEQVTTFIITVEFGGDTINAEQMVLANVRLAAMAPRKYTEECAAAYQSMLKAGFFGRFFHRLAVVKPQPLTPRQELFMLLDTMTGERWWNVGMQTYLRTKRDAAILSRSNYFPGGSDENCRSENCGTAQSIDSFQHGSTGAARARD